MIKDFNFNNIKVELPKNIDRDNKGKIEGNFAIISLNRPDQLNAITQETLIEIKTFLEKVEFYPEVRCVVLRGTKFFTKKPSFSSGIDLNQFPEPNIKPKKPYHKLYSTYLLHKYFNFIEKYPKPLIAAIDGYAIGGGCELALCCDIIIASKRSTFGFSEILRGIFPAGGGTQKMVKNIGLARTMKMFYFGELLSAEEMFNWGYVSYLVNDDEFEKYIYDKANRLANTPTIALLMIKKFAKLKTDIISDFSLQLELKNYEKDISSDKNIMELITLFSEKGTEIKNK
ncbi:MAG: enoyl-CoA hydratase/isomerase family protein [Candidatus Lokiarchaeota archaeon]|nr:enoyl-CoA hydratase/isomerase family protein [Candidatus Lokiarchaeota archaeon]